MQENLITSLQNPFLKEVAKLQQKAQERRKKGLFVAEGVREVSLALGSDTEPVNLIISAEIYQPDTEYPVSLEKYKPLIRYTSREAYNKIAYRKNAEGIILIAKKFQTELESIALKSNPLLVVLESVEKPGNLGAILRTADAAGADAIVICDPQTDIFNPNVIRSSLGCVFTKPIAVCRSEEFLQWAAKKNIKTFIATLQSRSVYFEKDLTGPVAFVFGTEADGLSQLWYEKADEKIYIPMQGKSDSLNVSASVAVMLFEAQRQRLIREGV